MLFIKSNTAEYTLSIYCTTTDRRLLAGRERYIPEKDFKIISVKNVTQFMQFLHWTRFTVPYPNMKKA